MRQRLFGGYAPVHYPDAPGAPILGLYLVHEGGQRGVVGGVAVHHFVGQWKALRGDDERNHHLHAVRAFVAAVAEASFAAFGHVTLEVGAGQVVEQYLEIRLKQGFPALFQVAEQGLFVG